MKYSFESRVRFSELGEDRKMTINSVLDRFQDCSNFHSEAVGLGIDHLMKKKKVWLLSSWQICVNRYPGLGEKVITSTWAYDFRSFYGFRNFTLETKEGKVLAYAASVWFYFDLESGKPTRVDQEELDGYGFHEKFPMEYAPRKISLWDGGELVDSLTIKRGQLDMNHHVNNGEYVRMAADCLPEEFAIRQMRAEYKKQAQLGDQLISKLHRGDGLYTVSLESLNGDVYAIVEFS